MTMYDTINVQKFSMAWILIVEIRIRHCMGGPVRSTKFAILSIFILITLVCLVEVC